MDRDHLADLLLQTLETERIGRMVYETALQCAVDDELRSEWQRYLEQTCRHERVVLDLLATFEFDATARTPGREVMCHLGEALVTAMEMAIGGGDRESAELIAAECVVLAETKDHQNWELLGEVAQQCAGRERAALAKAYEEIEGEEDEHLYHTGGWCRELWIRSLGMRAALPPPPEHADEKSAAGAPRVKPQRAAIS